MATRGGSLQSLRRTNQEQLLTLLITEGPLHRAQLARMAGVSRTTVSTISAELIGLGLVTESEPGSGVDGRAREILSVAPSVAVVGGIDFTLTDIHCQLSDLAGRPLSDEGAKVPSDASADQRLAAAMALLDRLLADSGHTRSQVLGLCLGVPGQISRATGVVGLSLPGQPWVGVDVRGKAAELIDAPLFVENNTRLEAVAESMFGAGRDCDNFLYVGLSSGIGSGLFLDGTLYRGADGVAGEVGHVSVDPHGMPCPCGNVGCLVQYASVPAVLGALRSVMGEDVTIEEVLESAQEGGRLRAGVLADAGAVVGRVLANLVNVLNPDRIIVGGELARAGEVLLDPVRTSIARYAMSSSKNVDVVPAVLESGSRAGALGGVALVKHETPGLAAALLATVRHTGASARAGE